MQVGNHWIPATVTQKANTPHSYIVRTPEGHAYRRNRRHLKRSNTEEPLSNHDTTTVSMDELNDQTRELTFHLSNHPKPLRQVVDLS